MSKIYQLTEDQRDILDRLYFLDENDEEDVKEIEYLNKKLSEIHVSAERTIEFLSGIWLETRAINAQRKEAKQRAERRLKTAENAEERIKNRILTIMETFDIKKVSGDLCDIRMQLSPGSIVYDESFNVDLLPSYCVKVIPEERKPIAAEVKKYLEDGESIPGVSIVKSLGVRIS